MADDRSLKDVIRFLDPSGDITDADIAELTKELKFTDVLDIVTYVGKDQLPQARELLAKYDQRFATAQEAVIPQAPPGKIGGGVAKKPNGFKPIKPIGSSPTIAGTPTNPNGAMQQPAATAATTTQQTGTAAAQPDQEEQAQDLNDLLTNPATKNKPEVQQIANLLQRMNKQ